MSEQGRSAVVIGAGIGGLATAIALRDAGFRVEVHEAASELRPLGAGLSIWPNGVRALRALGLGAVAEQAPRTGGALRRADGSVLAEFDPDVIADRYGAPLVGVNRGDLQAALLAACGEPTVQLGSRLVNLDADVLGFADGSERRADLIVGADGLRSVVRDELVGDGDPVDSGIVAFRGLSDWSGEVPAGEWWAEGSAAGLLPLSGGLVYWYVAAHGEPDRSELERRLGDFADPVRQIVGATAAADVLSHRLYDRPPVKRWGAGAATLVGDAAHPMLPFLGQGACSALEDAVALGRAMAGAADLRTAIAGYESARIARTTKLVRGSRRASSAALARSAFAGALRNGIVGHLPAGLRLRQLDPIIGQAEPDPL